MRDMEFAKIFDEQSLKLEMFFRRNMKKAISVGDKALLAEDLVQLTCMMALENSRMPEYSSYPIKILLIEKAKNVLYDYMNPPKKTLKIDSLILVENEPAKELDAQKNIEDKSAIETVRRIADAQALHSLKQREDGYEDFEIAIEIGITQVNLRKRISRLREKIKLRWNNMGYF